MRACMRIAGTRCVPIGVFGLRGCMPPPQSQSCKNGCRRLGACWRPATARRVLQIVGTWHQGHGDSPKRLCMCCHWTETRAGRLDAQAFSSVPPQPAAAPAQPAWEPSSSEQVCGACSACKCIVKMGICMLEGTCLSQALGSVLRSRMQCLRGTALLCCMQLLPEPTELHPASRRCMPGAGLEDSLSLQALRAVHGPARVANGTAAHIDLADVLEASSTPGSPSESSLHSSLSGSSDPDDILLADPGQQVGLCRAPLICADGSCMCLPQVSGVALCCSTAHACRW